MICSLCPRETIQAKDNLCAACRLRPHMKIVCNWTPQLDDELTRVYRMAKHKKDLSAALTAYSLRFNVPRRLLGNRATDLKLRNIVNRLWTEPEIDYLRDHAGTATLDDMARKLNRTRWAVKRRLNLLGISSRVMEGFSEFELSKLFGIHQNRVTRWVNRGWLDLSAADRVTQESVERFVWEHMEDYRFASCDEWWLKTMLNPKIGTLRSVNRKPARKEAA